MAPKKYQRKRDDITKQPKIAAIEPPDMHTTDTIDSISFLDLNNDCLIEICKHLALSELCAFAEVCGRFQQTVKTHYGSTKSNVCKDISDKIWEDLTGCARSSLLRNFGASISSLQAKCYSYSRKGQFLIDMIVHYCGSALRDLVLENFVLDERVVRKLRPLLLGLSKFGIIDCKCTNLFFVQLPSNTPELLELDVRSAINKSCQNIPKFRKLETFSAYGLNAAQFRKFLINNQQLKAIIQSTSCDPECLPEITKHLPTVEKLQIVGVFDTHNYYYRSSFYDELLKLRSLKTLHLMNIGGNIMFYGSSIATSLPQIQELRIVGSSFMVETDFLEYIRHAKNLRKFDYQCDRKCDWSGTYPKLVDVLKAQNRTEHLHIVLRSAFPTLMVPEELSKAHQDLVTFELVHHNIWEPDYDLDIYI